MKMAATIIISVILAAAAATIVIRIIYNARRGAPVCGCGCAHCPHAKKCGEHSERK